MHGTDISRGWKGLVLVFCYVAFVSTIWIIERRPPTLGEIGEFAEHKELSESAPHAVLHVLLGIAAMMVGATVLVEAVRRIAHVESSQTQIGLTIVGFATGFELIVLAWRAARHQASEVVVAAVVGSFSYNVTMTLGAAAIAHPLLITDTTRIHIPLVAMILSLTVVILLASRKGQLRPPEGWLLLCLYAVFVFTVLWK